MKRTRIYIIAVHCICWLIFLSLPAIFVAGQSGNMKFSALLRLSGWLYFTSFIFIFYLHTNLLFPKLYFGRKYFLYFLSLLLLAIAVFYLRPFDRLAGWERTQKHQPAVKNDLPSPGTYEPHTEIVAGKSTAFHPVDNDNHKNGGHPKLDIVSIILFILIIALSITILVIKRWRIAVEQASRSEADKVNAELAILKAQINPHFLFNTLNNIYSLAVTKDENTAESIMKLSNIMRYITDEAKENFVSLRNETNFITDYIELQRLRLGSKVTLDFTVSGNLRDKLIAPLILITFIENVFKYGISNSEPSTISIDLKAEENSIVFFCRNKLFPIKHPVESTGIGINNTKKRLAHLYPGKHLLNIKEDNGFYSVHLVLQS